MLMRAAYVSLLIAVAGSVGACDQIFGFRSSTFVPARDAAVSDAPKVGDGPLARLDFKEASLQDVVNYLVEVSRVQDVEKQGMNLILKSKQADARVTLSLRRVTLHDALLFVTQITGTKFRIEGPAVIIED